MLFLDFFGCNDWVFFLVGIGNELYFYFFIGVMVILSQMIELLDFISFVKVCYFNVRVGNEVFFNCVNFQNMINVVGVVS